MRVENDRLDTEEGYGCRSWLGFNGAREWGYNDGSGLRLPESVNDGALLLSNVVVIPVPSFGVDGFTDTTQHSEGAEIVAGDVVFTKTTEETDGGGGGVELGDLVLLDGLPVARRGRVNGGRFEDSGADAVEKGSVDDVTDERVRSEGVLAQNMDLTCDQ